MVALAMHRREKEKQRIKREEEMHKQRDFNPVSGLLKNKSTENLIERHGDQLKKMHQYHWEAQHDIGAKDRLHKYTVQSHVTDNINKDYGDMHNEIEGMVNSLENKVRGDQEKFLIEFESALRKLHARYRELENKNGRSNLFQDLGMIKEF